MTLEKIKNILLLVLIGLVVFLWLFNGCSKPVKEVPTLDLKPELKTQDSLLSVIDKLDHKSDSAVRVALKFDSVADHYKNRYQYYKSKYLAKEDTTPCGTEIKFITESCDSVIAKDSLRNLAWKKVHEIDSTEKSTYKNLHLTDTTIIGKQSRRITSDSIIIHKLGKKVKFWKGATKVAFVGGAALGGYGGYKLK